MNEAKEEGLAELVERGGIFYRIPGRGPDQILTEIIGGLPTVFLPIGKEILLRAVLEREALMSTGIGCGLALPHPRNPVISEAEKQFVTIAFPESPVNWNSLDGKDVYAVLLIVSASAKLHLHTLSKINFLCQQKSFETLLQSRASPEDIIKAIRNIEQTWKK
ncbi:PTS IIA-like nitrogen regulatory protein PtsN [Spirochaetia bacterium]|nr:PTS IIA-like nitrogen regulatory protein PtsN [Spirochaetia bacterium]